jgi:hypothetical protein
VQPVDGSMAPVGRTCRGFMHYTREFAIQLSDYKIIDHNT